MADIAAASVYSLASVYGISEDAAYSIKRISSQIISKAILGVKIRLSTVDSIVQNLRFYI